MYTSANMYGKDDMDQNTIPMHAQMQAQQHGGYMPVQHLAYQQQASIPGAGSYMMTAGGGGGGMIDYSQPPAQAYDRFPLVCSIIAMICCPISCFCSIPALVCSLCGYTDYRVHDLPEFRKKTDCSRRLVIAACLFALLFWIGSAVLSFYFYKKLFEFIQDVAGRYNSRSGYGSG